MWVSRPSFSFREHSPQLQTSPSLKDVGVPALCLSPSLPAIHAPAWEHPVDFTGKKAWGSACCTLHVAYLQCPMENKTVLFHYLIILVLNPWYLRIFPTLRDSATRVLSVWATLLWNSVQSSQEPIYFLLLLGNCFHKGFCERKPEISGKTAFNNLKIKTLIIWKLI